MSIFLHGLSLKNYRGIGSETQQIGPFKKCNFFIGTNNSGKSCVLNFLSSYLATATHSTSNHSSRLPLTQLEVHLGKNEEQVEVGFGVPLTLVREALFPKLANSGTQLHSFATSGLDKLLSILSTDGLIWLHTSATSLDEIKFTKPTDDLWRNVPREEWNALWRCMTNSSGGDLMDHWIPQVLSRILLVAKLTYPVPKLIPAKRQIGVSGKSFDDFSGAGLIDRLAELQNPRPTDRHLKKNFEKINSFLQDVTGDATAMIEIPHDRHEVLVHREERVLPLSSLGTGIHEVVMIAAFCTLTEGGIVCIEEPEIHLHPLLQKKLIRYVNDNTTNQYFVATHSASVIDLPNAAVFYVTHHDQATKIRLVTGAAQRFRICQDLGYRASDLLQANAIIWVEGPSDRIYLKHWMSAFDPTLLEGVHYAIMFYGGRLLSHLSADDEEVSEFISLRKLNQNMAIIIDSDRKSPHAKLNETKKRIIREFGETPDLAWVTAGREIENYVATATLDNALAKIYPTFGTTESTDKFAHRLHFFPKGSGSVIRSDADKVKVARAVCQEPIDFNIFDLNEKISKIVQMVRNSNI